MRPTIVMTASALIATLAGCSDIQTTSERSALLNSPGPALDNSNVDDFLKGLQTVRKFYQQTASLDGAGSGIFLNLPDPADGLGAKVNKDRLLHARTLMFAYVDSRCDAYLDAIYWANRTQAGIASGNNALATATETVLGVTGASTTVLTVVAAAFGLSGSLFDSYYEAVLNGLEPSSVRNIVDKAQIATRKDLKDDVTSEAEVLQQVQDYIRQCTPANIKYLVDTTLKTANVTTSDTGDAATRTAAIPAALPPEAEDD